MYDLMLSMLMWHNLDYEKEQRLFPCLLVGISASSFLCLFFLFNPSLLTFYSLVLVSIISRNDFW